MGADSSPRGLRCRGGCRSSQQVAVLRRRHPVLTACALRLDSGPYVPSGFPFGKSLIPRSLSHWQGDCPLFFLVAAGILTSGDYSTRKLSVPGRTRARAVLAVPQLCWVPQQLADV